MPYAHKLTTYEDMPRVKIVYCSVCGQEEGLSGPCPGEPVLTAKDDANFMRIFGGSPVKTSKELTKIMRERT